MCTVYPEAFSWANDSLWFNMAACYKTIMMFWNVSPSFIQSVTLFGGNCGFPCRIGSTRVSLKTFSSLMHTWHMSNRSWIWLCSFDYYHNTSEQYMTVTKLPLSYHIIDIITSSIFDVSLNIILNTRELSNFRGSKTHAPQCFGASTWTWKQNVNGELVMSTVGHDICHSIDEAKE